jgi:hypothetical protein
MGIKTFYTYKNMKYSQLHELKEFGGGIQI